MNQKKLRIGVIFGGRSAEHGISIFTARQVLDSMDRSKYELLPLYVNNEGECFLIGWDFAVRDHLGLPQDATSFEKFARDSGKRILLAGAGKKSLAFEISSVPLFGSVARPLDIDVALPLIHGTHGEDGTMPGLLELADIPYAGSGVLGSAVCMDKTAAKAILKASGIPVADHVWFNRSEWNDSRQDLLCRIGELGLPVFVKPANLGSSIAVFKVDETEQVEFAIDVALNFDHKCVVERSIEGALDINCAVLGGKEPITSVCERPLKDDAFLTYHDKYLKGSKFTGLAAASREVPARIPDSVASEIRALALNVFRVLNCDGCVRIDFLVQTENWKIHVNEVNTVPGSLAFYLWEASGIEPQEVVDRLVAAALEKYKQKQETIYHPKEHVLRSRVPLGGQ